MINKVLAAAILICVITTLTGCVAAIGNGDTRGATLGQQLVDLQKAKDSGAITDAEFQEQKARLLKRH
jgi:hypothetical protein